jgi:pyruvate kinase
MKRTKIVCTIGPSSNSEKMLTQMIKAGMNVARLNFSHGKYSEHKKVINLIRKISAKLDQPVAILQDLQGPRIRLGELPGEGIELKNRAKVVLTTNPKAKLPKIPVTYNKLHLDVKKGQTILLVDGLINLKIDRVSAKDIHCTVINGGMIYSHKGLNLPQTKLSIPTITLKDKKDLDFGIKNKVDLVALSFVRSADDVNDLKKMIARLDKKYQGKKAALTQVIVKIEKPEAVKNINKIIAATDGVMIGRGDLGIEIPAEKVPIVQKDIINKCLAKAKPVIVATQMLDSMIDNPRPTRAEVSDVANAVIDHTDAIMLSGETANGKYPLQSVEMMADIAKNTEKSKYDDFNFRQQFKGKIKDDEAISSGADLMAKNLKAKAVLVASLSGTTAKLISRYRPELPILVATNDEKIRRQLNLSWGVVPFVLPKCKTVEELTSKSLAYVKNKKWYKAKDKLIIIAGFPVGRSGTINWINIHEIK